MNVLFGRVEYITNHVNENILEDNDLIAVSFYTIDINHNTDGHEILINVKQGLSKPDKKSIALAVESVSQFKVVPYNKTLFTKPLGTGLIHILVKLIQTAAAQNTGMFCIIREDYGKESHTPPMMFEDEIKSQLYNKVQGHLFN